MRIFEDGATKPVIFKRHSTFGYPTPEKAYQREGFKHFDYLFSNI